MNMLLSRIDGPALVVISGADGAGKTTLIEALANRLRAQGLRVGVASLWDLYLAPALPRIFSSREDAQRYLGEVSARSRFHFLLHCLYGALDRALQPSGGLNEGSSSGGAAVVPGRYDVLLFDAYWYKYAAAERCFGAGLDGLLPLVQDFPVPDVILELDAPPALTAARKRSFGLYECGLKTATPAAFIAFQTGLRRELRELLRAQPCPRVALDATRPLESSLEQALAAVVDVPGLAGARARSRRALSRDE
jgi:thymidylate kinase